MVLVVAACLLRPLLPIDETRYVSVAWEMRHTGSFLVPHINGVPYSHKPPLLFYLINLGWSLFGVSELSARMTVALVGLLDLLLTAHLARRLWPDDDDVGKFVPFVLLTMPLWAIMATLTMFDLLLCFFVLLAAVGLATAGGGRPAPGWSLVAAGIGGGLLAKGPVVLLFVLPPAILAPLWVPADTRTGWWRWYCWLVAALLAGIAIALLWAIPAAARGGTRYGHAILWGQTAGRIVKSFAHRRPWWWYLPILPLATLPWGCRLMGLGRRTLDRLHSPEKFCLSWSVPAFVLLSLVSGKQLHYLIPLLPALALLVARALSMGAAPSLRAELRTVAGLFLVAGISLLVLPYLTANWAQQTSHGRPFVAWAAAFMAAGVILLRMAPKSRTAAVATGSVAMVLFIILVHGVLFRQLNSAYNVAPLAARIAQLQQDGKTVAIYPRQYANQFHFAGRLDNLAGLGDAQDLQAWIKAHPLQYVVYISNRLPSGTPVIRPEFSRPFTDRWSSLWQAQALRSALLRLDADAPTTGRSNP
jgi:4-amino-4-deoxy-L-arabinose transferase-like glycosyltransferase